MPLPGPPLVVDRPTELPDAGVVVVGRGDEAVIVPEEVALAGQLAGQLVERRQGGGTDAGEKCPGKRAAIHTRILRSAPVRVKVDCTGK